MRSTLADIQLENCFDDDIFTDEITDESSEYSGESDEDEINKYNTSYFSFQDYFK